MSDLLQLAGAVLILIPFAAVQMGRMSPAAVPYLLFNLVGSALLAWLALVDEQWGFLLLETVWALVSAWGLARRARGRPLLGTH